MSPPGICSRKVHHVRGLSPLAFNHRESQQNGGTETSHVTPLCVRVRFREKQMHTTRLTNKISHSRDLTTTAAVERLGKIQYSSRSVVCTKRQIWRPFCTSLRRQHSGAPRYENTAKASHRQSGSNTKKHTDSSSFSIPVGICGTARLIEAYSCRSGKSSQRNTGRGLLASSARARNDNLLIFLY